MHVYDKGDKEDLTADQKRVLKDLGALFRREAMVWAQQTGRRGRERT
jgi:hypothetical protein